MMEQHSYTVLENSCIARDVYRMLLGGPTEAFTAPGQFLDLRLDGFYLRRPISLCDLQPVGPVIVYKVVGHGTAALAQIKTGAQLDALVGLGNGFDLTKGGDAPLLVGGGCRGGGRHRGFRNTLSDFLRRCGRISGDVRHPRLCG